MVGIYRASLFIVLLLALLGWTALVLYLTPEGFVEWIGVENSYLFAFLLATTAGVTTVTGYSFTVTLLALSAGGADPILLGIAGGVGIFISDTILYFIFRYGVRTYAEQTHSFTTWLLVKTKGFSTPVLLTAIFCYVSFLPFPNDPLLLGLALHGLPYRVFAPVLLVGSITLVLLMALFGNLVLGGL